MSVLSDRTDHATYTLGIIFFINLFNKAILRASPWWTECSQSLWSLEHSGESLSFSAKKVDRSLQQMISFNNVICYNVRLFLYMELLRSKQKKEKVPSSFDTFV